MIKKFGAALLVITMSWGLTACGLSDLQAKLDGIMTEMDIVVDPATISADRQPQSNAAERQEQSASARQGTTGTSQQETKMRIRVTAGGSEVIFELNDTSAAGALYAQLPLTVDVEENSDNEKVFYPEYLDCTDAIEGDCSAGTLAYSSLDGNVVMYSGSASQEEGLYILGEAVEGAGNISGLTGEIEITRAN